MSVMFICNKCMVASPLEAWDYATIKNCTNRKQRRAYVSISKEANDKWYTCPVCSANVSNKYLKGISD